MSGGRAINVAASYLCDKDDETLLTHAELAASWGGPIEFMHSYGLYPHEQEDLDDAVELSRAYKEADDYCDETDEDDKQGSNQDHTDLEQEGQEENEMGSIGTLEELCLDEYCASLYESNDDAYSSDGDQGGYSSNDDAYSSDGDE